MLHKLKKLFFYIGNRVFRPFPLPRLRSLYYFTAQKQRPRMPALRTAARCVSACKDQRGR